MNLNIINLPDEQATEHLAKRLAACLHAPLLLTFRGELGAGKTTFIRAMLRGMGIDSPIKSPTFSLVESYTIGHGMNCYIHHFDLYRVQEVEELEYIGFRDYFAKDAICCIEWPEKAGSMLSVADLACTLKIVEHARQLEICAQTPIGLAILSCLEEQ